MGETVSDESAELFLQLLSCGKAVAQSDKGDRDFAGSGIGSSDDAALAHGWMLEQNGFHFSGSDGEALVLDHFLATIDNAVKAFHIASNNVA